jgi:protein-S-isoprenylcysteine O-methyltransferase Ste14
MSMNHPFMVVVTIASAYHIHIKPKEAVHMTSDKQISKSGLVKAALVKYGSVFVIVGILLFIPAGTLSFWNAWLYLASLFIPMLFVGVYLFRRDPELLAKRMKSNEREKAQKLVIILSLAAFFPAYILPGLDFRFGWSHIPLPAVIAACLVMLAGYTLFVAVLMQNSFASRVVEVQEGQKIIDTGVYHLVRHPMYLASIILFLSSPIVLGSWFALIPMLIYPVTLVMRIKNEEKVLASGLPGYGDYMKKVKYRLIPYIW